MICGAFQRVRIERHSAVPGWVMHRNAKYWMMGATATLLVGSLAAWYVQPSPVDYARECLAERRGVATDELELVGWESCSPLTPVATSTMTVEFRIKGVDRSPKQVVELFRVVYFLPWWVTAYREGKE
jgi:hypothetical protein